MNCPCCRVENVNDLDNTFGRKTAESDARAYRKNGLDRRAKKLIEFVSRQLPESATMLEVGGGAGALHHDLLRRGVVSAVTGVDASTAYLQAAADNAAHFGLTEQVTYLKQDFAQSAENVEKADLVVLDRVICCYPHLEQLLGNAAQRATRFLAISYPIDRNWLRLGHRVVDTFLSLVKSGYHPYVHRQSAIDAVAAAHGLRPVHQDRHFIWQVKIFERI